METEDVSGLIKRLRILEKKKEAIFLELEELVKVEPSRVELLKQRIRQLIGEFKEELRIIEEMVQNSRKGGAIK